MKCCIIHERRNDCDSLPRSRCRAFRMADKSLATAVPCGFCLEQVWEQSLWVSFLGTGSRDARLIEQHLFTAVGKVACPSVFLISDTCASFALHVFSADRFLTTACVIRMIYSTTQRAAKGPVSVCARLDLSPVKEKQLRQYGCICPRSHPLSVTRCRGDACDRRFIYHDTDKRRNLASVMAQHGSCAVISFWFKHAWGMGVNMTPIILSSLDCAETTLEVFG